MDRIPVGILYAVSCSFPGFIAENIREQVVDHEKEKQYMESLLTDLSSDTATINTAIPLKEARIRSIDTVFIFFNSSPGAKTISGKLFKTIRHTNYDSRFIRNNITFNQLKNAGGMRLVRKKQVSDSISAYDLYCETIISLYNELYINNSQVAARQFEKLYFAADLLPFYIVNSNQAIVANIPDSIIIRINATDLNEQLNFMMQEKAYARQEIDRYKIIEGRAVRLMELIKSEYHLE